MTRRYTRMLLEMIESDMLDEQTVINACLNYMSEDDVKEMMRVNDFLPDDENDSEEINDDEENGC